MARRWRRVRSPAARRLGDRPRPLQPRSHDRPGGPVDGQVVDTVQPGGRAALAAKAGPLSNARTNVSCTSSSAASALPTSESANRPILARTLLSDEGLEGGSVEPLVAWAEADGRRREHDRRDHEQNAARDEPTLSANAVIVAAGAITKARASRSIVPTFFVIVGLLRRFAPHGRRKLRKGYRDGSVARRSRWNLIGVAQRRARGVAARIDSGLSAARDGEPHAAG
jgi:hypothetical protein